MPDFSWMAWTFPTALFFAFIALLILLMGVWEWRRPGGDERLGILGIITTRGDRLFVSLLCAAYVHLGWLYFSDWHIAGATVLSTLLAAAIFKKV